MCIERSTTFRLTEDSARALEKGENLRDHDVYGRFGTQTQRESAAMVAGLEGAEAGHLFASGMAALSATFFTLIPAGGRIVVAKDLYGGSENFIHRFAPGREVQRSYFDATSPASLREQFETGPHPDLVLCESISNPCLRVSRVAEIADICRQADTPLLVDATFTAGMGQRPLELGADLVMHSATKYLNGHSDVVAGVICGTQEHVDAIASTSFALGSCLDPSAAYLLARGLKTLPLRWDRQSATAQVLAQRLAEHCAIERVYYPGLDPGAREQGPLLSFGGVLSFDLREPSSLNEVLSRLQLCIPATSLGGIETLVCVPRRSTHALLSPQEWESRGIGAGMMRISVGLEDVEDLWDDLRQALA